GPSGTTSHVAILFWLSNLSRMAARTLATHPSHEFAISTKKRPNVFSPQYRNIFHAGDFTFAIVHVEIVVTAAAVLLGADKGERSGGGHVTRSTVCSVEP